MKPYGLIGAVVGAICMAAPASAMPRPASPRAEACSQRMDAVRGEMTDTAITVGKKAADALIAKAGQDLAMGRTHACMVALDDATFALHHPSSNPNYGN